MSESWVEEIRLAEEVAVIRWEITVWEGVIMLLAGIYGVDSLKQKNTFYKYKWAAVFTVYSLFVDIHNLIDVYP